jgi:diguanylate cyclase (GGDEF)-like protein
VEPPSAELRAELDRVALDSLRPASLGLAVLFALLLPFDFWRSAGAQRTAALDALVLLPAALSALLCGMRRLPAPRASPALGALALLVLLNLIFAGRGEPLGIWVCLLSLGALGLPLHFARRRSHERLFALHQGALPRQAELQRALEAADEVRRTLDLKVAERTEELSRATAELRLELLERQRSAEERVALQARLEHDALHDALTGLANRALFLDRLEHAWKRTRREPGFRFAVLYLDLDRFKVINDTFGHEIGDQLLVGIGRRLPTCLRPTDTVARLGGDEFAVLLENFTNAAETLAIAARIHTALQKPFKIDVHEIYASASIGIADGVVEGQLPEQYVRDADVAMYAAKSRGTPFERFDGGMHSPALARMRMETELRAAIEREQFFVVYQPIVDLRTTRLEGFEALVRWRHPSRGVVAPDEFIGLAEETRLILPLSLFVIRHASRQAAEWRRRYPGTGPLLGVNLSPLLLTRPGMAAEILAVLAETGLSPKDLAVEVTESAVMAQPQVASAMLGELRACGVQVFVDDFGTGYSSLAYLTTLPVDRLKIDRSFVAAMSDPNRLRVVRTIASLAHDLGKSLVAEGVETPAQLDTLRSMGCEFAQGWLFSRPMDAAQAGALLEANERACAFPGLVEPTLDQALLDEATHQEAATAD